MRDTLWKNSKSKVNDGESVLFWEDMWLGNAPLQQMEGFNMVAEWAKTNIGCWAKVYITKEDDLSNCYIPSASNTEIE